MQFVPNRLAGALLLARQLQRGLLMRYRVRCLWCAQPTLQEPQERGPVIILSLEAYRRSPSQHAEAGCKENTKEVSVGWCVRAVGGDQRPQTVYSILELSRYSEGPAGTPHCSPQAPLRLRHFCERQTPGGMAGVSVAICRSPAPSQAGSGWDGTHYHPPPQPADVQPVQ